MEEDLKLELLSVGERCSSVVCCRVSPIQKALVVKLVKDNRQVRVCVCVHIYACVRAYVRFARCVCRNFRVHFCHAPFPAPCPLEQTGTRCTA